MKNTRFLTNQSRTYELSIPPRLGAKAPLTPSGHTWCIPGDGQLSGASKQTVFKCFKLVRSCIWVVIVSAQILRFPSIKKNYIFISSSRWIHHHHHHHHYHYHHHYHHHHHWWLVMMVSPFISPTKCIQQTWEYKSVIGRKPKKETSRLIGFGLLFT